MHAGTGKTHTMLGTVKEPGIMMITLNDLYRRIEETNNHMTYKVSMAYVEVQVHVFTHETTIIIN